MATIVKGTQMILYRLIVGGGLKITNSADLEIIDLLKNLELFRLTDTQAPQMVEKMKEDIEKRVFCFNTLKQFSKWCKTDIRYIRPQEIAKEISVQLFGEVIPRLCDQSNQVHPDHIKEYEKFLERMIERGCLENPDDVNEESG